MLVGVEAQRGGKESYKEVANRTSASCMIQPQYLISSGGSAKLYLLMVMLFRGTYLFILRGLVR